MSKNLERLILRHSGWFTSSFVRHCQIKMAFCCVPFYHSSPPPHPIKRHWKFLSSYCFFIYISIIITSHITSYTTYKVTLPITLLTKLLYYTTKNDTARSTMLCLPCGHLTKKIKTTNRYEGKERKNKKENQTIHISHCCYTYKSLLLYSHCCTYKKTKQYI